MNLQPAEIECPRREIAAYVDGDLLPRAEIELERHVAACSVCASELNEQKRLLCALEFALDVESEFALPENFTRVVVANAESKVSGLRSPSERFRAIFVVACLFLMFLIGIGGEVKTVAATAAHFGEQILAVGSFTWHLIYNIAVGASIVLRSVGSQFVANPFSLAAFIAVFFSALLFALARFFNRFNQS